MAKKTSHKRSTRVSPLKEWFEKHPKVLQRVFARSVGVSQPHISLIVSGVRRGSEEVRAKIAKKTGIPVKEL